MGFSFVSEQQNDLGSTGTGTVVKSVTSGNLLVCVVDCYNEPINSVGDNQGNVWKTAFNSNGLPGYAAGIGIFYAWSGTTASNTVTITWGSGGSPAAEAALYEFSGVSKGLGLSVVAHCSTPAGNGSFTAGPITSPSGNSLLIGGLIFTNGNITGGFGGSWQDLVTVDGNLMSYLISSSSTTYNVTATGSPNTGPFASAIVALVNSTGSNPILFSSSN